VEFGVWVGFDLPEIQNPASSQIPAFLKNLEVLK